jgi:ABC-2 type transport system permease protein
MSVEQPLRSELSLPASLPAAVSASLLGASLSGASLSRASLWRMCVLEAKCEFLKLLRTPHYAVPILALPVMFYLLFGSSFGNRGPSGGGPYLLASYAVFGVVTAALFAFGAGVALERAQGWLLLKRTTPMPVGVYLGAKVLSCMLFGVVIVALLAACAILLGGVHLSLGAWLTLLVIIAVGSIPFCLFGLLIALVVPPSGAPGIVNLINLPLAFAGGLWMPVSSLPRVFQALAPVLPQYHLAQLALGAVGVPPAGSVAAHGARLVLASVVFGAAAMVAWRRADARDG